MQDKTRQTDDAPASSRLTLPDMLRAVAMACGCPDPATDAAVTVKQLLGEHPEDHVVWVLQEWLRGRIEAYDPLTLQLVLSPRNHPAIHASWDYLAGAIPSGGASVTFGKLPARLPLYGTFSFTPDGVWRFTLHSQDRPVFRRITSDRPVTFSIPCVKQGGLSAVEEASSLFLRIEREDGVGFVASAEYDGVPIFGVNAAIHDLAQDCLCAGVFGRDILSPRGRRLWENALAWFFSKLFTRRLPRRMEDLATLGSPENLVLHQARSAIAARLSTVIFDRDRVMETITAFPADPKKLFPEVEAIQIGSQVLSPVHPHPNVSAEPLEAEQAGECEVVAEVPRDIYALMAEKLPELLPRSMLPRMCEELLGTKLIGKSTLEKLDMKKVGPPSVEIGGRVHYRRDEFIRWFRGRNAGKGERSLEDGDKGEG